MPQPDGSARRLDCRPSHDIVAWGGRETGGRVAGAGSRSGLSFCAREWGSDHARDPPEAFSGAILAVGFVFYAVVTLIWLVPDRRIERVLTNAEAPLAHKSDRRGNGDAT